MLKEELTECFGESIRQFETKKKGRYRFDCRTKESKYFMMLRGYIGPIAKHALQKIESRMKPSAQHPSDVRNCHHNEL